MLALLAFSFVASPSWADSYIAIHGGGGEYRTRPATLLDMRFKNIVRQRYDFSCGSAALATLLNYYYEIPVDEMHVLKSMYDIGNQEMIRKEGFSLLDMKNYLTTLGFNAVGFRESLDKLQKVSIPAIVLINRKGYMHFVVITGVTQNKVLVADPAIGMRVYSRRDFSSIWQNGILFVIMNEMGTARKHFNTRQVWGRKIKPDFQMALQDADLARISLNIMPLSNYY